MNICTMPVDTVLEGRIIYCTIYHQKGVKINLCPDDTECINQIKQYCNYKV